MGDINFDLTESERFNYIVYGCAAIGGAIGAFAVPSAPAIAIAAHVAAGAVVGGIGLPLAITGVALGGLILGKTVKEIWKSVKTEATALPLAVAVIGISSAKAMFVSPLKVIKNCFNSHILGKKDNDEEATPSTTPAAKVDLKLTKKESQKDFNSGAEKKKKPAKKAKNTPKSKPKA